MWLLFLYRLGSDWGFKSLGHIGLWVFPQNHEWSVEKHAILVGFVSFCSESLSFTVCNSIVIVSPCKYYKSHTLKTSRELFVIAVWGSEKQVSKKQPSQPTHQTNKRTPEYLQVYHNGKNTEFTLFLVTCISAPVSSDLSISSRHRKCSTAQCVCKCAG